MKLIAMSRREIESETPGWADEGAGPSIAICIAYPDGRLHRVSPLGSLRAVLHLRFSDCDGEGRWCFNDSPDARAGLPAVPMSREQATDILAFVEKWRGEVETIYAACYGGISRSRGILAGLAAVHGWDDREVYRAGQPNAWCKVQLVRQHVQAPEEGGWRCGWKCAY